MVVPTLLVGSGRSAAIFNTMDGCMSAITIAPKLPWAI